MAKAGLTIAFFFELLPRYLAKGYTLEECGELDKQDTIDAIAEALEELGHTVVQVGDLDDLVQCIAKGEHQQWDIALSISEGMHGRGREAQIPGVLEAYRIPCVLSDAACLSLSLDKARTKMVLEHFSIPTAPFALIAADCQDVLQAIQQSPHAGSLGSYPLFVKPTCEGSSKGIYDFSKVDSAEQLMLAVDRLRGLHPGQDIILERYLDGREYSVSIIGSGSSSTVIGTVHLDWDGSRSINLTENGDQPGFLDAAAKNHDKVSHLLRYDLDPKDSYVQASEELAVRAWRAMACRDVGRVDIRWDREGHPYVLEINPLPGLRKGFSILPETAKRRGIDYIALLKMIVESALERYPHLKTSPTNGVHPVWSASSV